MSTMVQESELQHEIEKTAKREGRFGWANYFAAYFVALLALAGSIAATILVAYEVQKSITAFVAAIPATAIAVTKIFNFERRSLYHWRKSKKIRGLLRKLKYEGVDTKIVSREFTKIETETLDEWIAFGVGDKGDEE